VDAAGPGSSERIAVSALVDESAAASTIDNLIDDRASLKALVNFCLFHLGYGATEQDAEDALQDFCAKRRQKVIDSYKPGSQTVTTYFKVCLKRFCWQKGKQLRQRRRYQESLKNGVEVVSEREDSSALQKILADADERERESEQSRLVAAIAQLTPAAQNLILVETYDRTPAKRGLQAMLNAT
jgi:DNA-directed RNA polymerase specialized sigma24 family protein